MSRRSHLLPLLALFVALGGCSEQVINHGTYFHDSDLAQVQPGMSQAEVRSTLGTPSTTATVNNGEAFYYISSRMTQTAFLDPTETDRKVVAVYFDHGGAVERVANYGMQDGKVIDYVSRTTPAPGGKEQDLLSQLFRNLGKQQKIFGDG